MLRISRRHVGERHLYPIQCSYCQAFNQTLSLGFTSHSGEACAKKRGYILWNVLNSTKRSIKVVLQFKTWNRVNDQFTISRYEIYDSNKNQPPNSLVMIVTMICFMMCMPEIQEVGEMPGICFWFLPHSENFQRTAIPYPHATDVYFSARIGDSRAFFNCIFRVICVDDNELNMMKLRKDRDGRDMNAFI